MQTLVFKIPYVLLRNEKGGIYLALTHHPHITRHRVNSTASSVTFRCDFGRVSDVCVAGTASSILTLLLRVRACIGGLRGDTL